MYIQGHVLAQTLTRPVVTCHMPHPHAIYVGCHIPSSTRSLLAPRHGNRILALQLLSSQRLRPGRLTLAGRQLTEHAMGDDEMASGSSTGGGLSMCVSWTKKDAKRYGERRKGNELDSTDGKIAKMSDHVRCHVLIISSYPCTVLLRTVL